MATMTFYKFSSDQNGTQSIGFAIANAKDFDDDAQEDFLYIDPTTGKWTSESERTDPSYDLEDAMQDMASAYGADGIGMLDNEPVTSSIRSDYDKSRRLADEMKYAIDIDLKSMTATGSVSNIIKWKRDRMPYDWNDVEEDFSILNDMKDSTMIMDGRDGKTHLFVNGIDNGQFDSVDEAKDAYESDWQSGEDYVHETAGWQQLLDVDNEEDDKPAEDVNESDKQTKTAGVWKLTLDAPLTAMEKKAFLDNSVNVDQTEDDEGTVVLTMSGNDKAAADTAEYLGLTDNFTEEARPASDEDADLAEEDKQVRNEDEAAEPEAPAPDPDKEKVKDDISSLLDSMKSDVSNTASRRCSTVKDMLSLRPDLEDKIVTVHASKDIKLVRSSSGYWTATSEDGWAVDPRLRLNSASKTAQALVDRNIISCSDPVSVSASADVAQDSETGKYDVYVKNDDGTSADVKTFDTEQEAEAYAEGTDAQSDVTASSDVEEETFTVTDDEGCSFALKLLTDDSSNSITSIVIPADELAEDIPLDVSEFCGTAYRDNGTWHWLVCQDQIIRFEGDADMKSDAEGSISESIKQFIHDVIAETSCSEQHDEELPEDDDYDSSVLTEDYDLQSRQDEPEDSMLI